MNPSSHLPALCVVGHPNQGKSSIVATLTENDSVEISPQSGTTRQSATFRFVLNGVTVLELTDTPGFQRPAQLLDWLMKENVAPASRPERVRAFLNDPVLCERFPDEAELLAPVMAGGGILYVVDAAHPLSGADTAEMEILRWTGQPRMAVINPVVPVAEARQDEWRTTLGQYFQWVREFDPMTATVPARQTLLRALGELTPGWREPVERLVAGLAEREAWRLEEAVSRIADYWISQVTAREPVRALTGGMEVAVQRLNTRLQDNEEAFIAALKSAWGFETLTIANPAEGGLTTIDPEGLMHTEYWYLWGLNQRDLLLASGAAGAAAGAAIDVGLGGTSFALGTLTGGVFGSAGGWWAGRSWASEAAQTKRGVRRRKLPLVREKTFAGPVGHPNFPLVVMARALTVTRQLWLRPHARRDAMALQVTAEGWSRTDTVQLLRWTGRLQKPLRSNRILPGGTWTARQRSRLEAWIRDQLLAESDRISPVTLTPDSTRKKEGAA